LTVLFVGCGSDDEQQQPSSLITSAVCAEQATPAVNVLRYDCQVQTSSQTQVQIEYGPADDSSRRSTAASTGTNHQFTLYNLKANNTYTWQTKAGSEVQSGTFTTAALPAQLDNATFEIRTACSTCHTEYALFAFGCSAGSEDDDFLIIIDTAGAVVWYQDLSSIVGGSPAAVGSLSLSDEGAILLLVDRQWIIELDLSGKVLLSRCIREPHPDSTISSIMTCSAQTVKPGRSPRMILPTTITLSTAYTFSTATAA